ELAFVFLKANFRFTRLSVRGKEKMENELGFAFMVVNLKKCIAMNRNQAKDQESNPEKNGFNHQRPMIEPIFTYSWLVTFQPLLCFLHFK
ncbi:MAG TPA: IS5/IS1182 family transposase, partial [Virgibacillus sp.]|nr:IS5/IS1182 family transposase [Virgibacillus sp.]